MVKIGTKRDQLLIKVSKLIIYFWLLFSILVSIIINQKIDINNIWMSLIIYANIFIPLYMVIFSIPLNNKYKYRLLKSIIALVPIIVCYLILFNDIYLIDLNLIYLFIGIIIILLLNFSLTANKNDYALILLTIYFMMSSLVLGYIQNNGINNYLLVNHNNLDSLFMPGYVLIILFGVLFAFINHIYQLLILERKSKCLK